MSLIDRLEALLVPLRYRTGTTSHSSTTVEKLETYVLEGAGPKTRTLSRAGGRGLSGRIARLSKGNSGIAPSSVDICSFRSGSL